MLLCSPPSTIQFLQSEWSFRSRKSSRIPLGDDAFKGSMLGSTLGQQYHLKHRLKREEANYLLNGSIKFFEVKDRDSPERGILFFEQRPDANVCKVHLDRIRSDSAAEPTGNLILGDQTAESSVVDHRELRKTILEGHGENDRVGDFCGNSLHLLSEMYSNRVGSKKML